MNLNDDITYLKGVGEKRAKLFHKLDIQTVGDLLTHYPRDYIDFTSPVPMSELMPDDNAVFCGIVTKKLKPYIGRQYSIYKAVVSDNTDDITLVFFNSEYVFERLSVGHEYIFYGKLRGNIIEKECNSPVFINSSEKNRLAPKYSSDSSCSSDAAERKLRQLWRTPTFRIFLNISRSRRQTPSFAQ